MFPPVPVTNRLEVLLINLTMKLRNVDECLHWPCLKLYSCHHNYIPWDSLCVCYVNSAQTFKQWHYIMLSNNNTLLYETI